MPADYRRSITRIRAVHTRRSRPGLSLPVPHVCQPPSPTTIETTGQAESTESITCVPVAESNTGGPVAL